MQSRYTSARPNQASNNPGGIPLRILTRIAGALFLLTIIGCSSLNLPSVTAEATAARFPGKVIWRDLISEDPAVSQRFYGDLFGWTFRAVPRTNYSIILHAGEPIGGMVDARVFEQQDNISQWVVALSVNDIDAAVSSIKSAGGSILGGPTDAGDRGELAVAKDPQGANFALLETRDGDPLDREAGINDFMWHELWTTDSSQATAFYRQLASYTLGSKTMGDGRQYEFLETSGKPRIAIIDRPVDNLAPTWVPYVRVADTGVIATKAEELGGKVWYRGASAQPGGELAIIIDPTGAGLIVQTWTR